MSKTVTLGSFEVVSLPELGLNDVVAKVDTGAYSGAIHCTNIKVVQRSKKPVLAFTPAGIPNLTYETEDFKRRLVRSSTGHQIHRYIINTTITIRGVNYRTNIGLSDRSDLRKQVLIGRRFLREQQMLVDVSQNAAYDDEGESRL